MKRPFPFHPPLFAIYPALSLYAANVALISWRDIAVPILLAIFGSLALWGVVWVVLRDLQRSAAAASAIIVGCFTYDLMSRVWATFLGEVLSAHTRAPLWLWAPIVLGVAVMIGWKWRATPKVAQFLNFVSTVLCVFSMGSILLAHWGIRNEVARRSADAPNPIGTASKKPDVIYIILDGYGRTDTFERLYGFSDKAFVKQLENEGFYVARDARTNYCQTELSLASSLNMAPIEDIVEKGGDTVRIRAVLDERIDDSRVAREFKMRGYRYIAITTGFPALKFDTADVRMERDSGATLYLNALLEKTPLPPSKEFQGSQFAQRRKFLIGGLDALKDLSRPSSTPRFVVAHILAPHPPFVFGSNGEEVRPKESFGLWDGSHYNEMEGTDEDYRAGYREQAQYLAKTLLETLSSFKGLGETDPIILIQGDHGPKSELDQGSLEKTDVNEVFPILSAYRVPESIRKSLYPGISPINSFRIILSSLFQEDFPKLPDRSYYSTWEEPTTLTEVTSHIVQRQAAMQEIESVRRTGASAATSR